MGFTFEDFWEDDGFQAEQAGNALARSIAHTAAASGDDLVVAIFAASKCRIERTHDDSGVWYTVRVATPPAPFAVYLQNQGEPVEGRVQRYGGALLENVRRIVIAPAIHFEPGWESRLIAEYFGRNPEATRENTDADTLSRLLRLPGECGSLNA